MSMARKFPQNIFPGNCLEISMANLSDGSEVVVTRLAQAIRSSAVPTRLPSMHRLILMSMKQIT